MRNKCKITFCFLLVLVFMGVAHAETVLYLGDSHSVGTGFESELYKSFHQRGDALFSEAACSARPGHWVNSPERTEFPCWLSRNSEGEASGGRRPGLPQVPDLAKKIGPAKIDIVVIELGDNMLGFSGPEVTEDCLKLLRALDQEMGHKKVRYYWLGPTWPSMRVVSSKPDYTRMKTIENTEKVRDGIKQAVERFKAELHQNCLFVDGMQIVGQQRMQEQPGDGLHFKPGSEAYQEWAHAAFKVMEESRSGAPRAGRQ
jgi:lysophospholipase L1-like esterase